MLSRQLLLLCLTASSVRAATSATDITFSQTLSTLTDSIPTSDFSDYTYLTPTGQSTLETTSSSSATATGSSNGTATNSTLTSSHNSQITVSTTSESLTVIGAITSSAGNATNVTATATSTSSSAQPTNTLPCNGYPEFCNRKYSNITEVCAHNSAFVVKNNAASNQMLPITNQLNDGVRMLQGETHWENNTVYNCHSSCSLLNAGTWQSELETVREWLVSNPYDVVTFLIVNSDFTSVENYVPAITNAGLLPYVYTPSYIPQHRDQWPTLGEMILRNQRMVFFMDYNANQTTVPYILDEFTHIWETPFSPQNQSFPCTQQRPPNLNQTEARDDYMYLANHNLNTAIDLSALLGTTGSDSSILIPNTAELNLTNGQQDRFGALGAMSLNCTADWGRPPNFLLVDYYNIGSPESGSVFHVAAAANGVTYTKQCCGVAQSTAPIVRASTGALVAAMIFMIVLAW